MFLDIWMHCIGVYGQRDGRSIGYNDCNAVSIVLVHSIKVSLGVCIYLQITRFEVYDKLKAHRKCEHRGKSKLGKPYCVIKPAISSEAASGTSGVIAAE